MLSFIKKFINFFKKNKTLLIATIKFYSCVIIVLAILIFINPVLFILNLFYMLYYIILFCYNNFFLKKRNFNGPELEIDTNKPIIAFFKTIWFLPKHRCFNVVDKIFSKKLKFKGKNIFFAIFIIFINLLLSFFLGITIFLYKLSVFIVRFSYYLVYYRHELPHELPTLLDYLK